MGLSIALATGLYGISDGALAVAAGLSVAQAMALSLLMFTGASQFAFVGVIGAGGAPVAALTTAALLGLRNGLYGVQINRLARPRAARKAVMAHLTIDESMATCTAQTEPLEQRRGFWTAGVGTWVLWSLFTLVGAMAGEVIGDPKRWGLDGAAIAAFIGLLWPRLVNRDAWAVAVVCGLVTVLVTPWLPGGIPILVAAVVAGVLGWTQHRGDPQVREKDDPVDVESPR